jgi:hypothetical protein
MNCQAIIHGKSVLAVIFSYHVLCRSLSLIIVSSKSVLSELIGLCLPGWWLGSLDEVERQKALLLADRFLYAY